ncbi:MAG TPA: M50 family metallopeptidase, partial [Ktedonobacterales bacterium]|nr:M50 family metallopeptidase [Ktedonobacterales bacterium]
IGFPPRLAGIKRGETLYSINWLPIGGFVRMPGENGETTDENGVPDPGAFASKSAGKRAAVLLAGVTMNLILAVVLFTGAEAVGKVQFPNVIQSVVRGSPAQAAGIQPGDKVLSVDGHRVIYFSDLQQGTSDAITSALSMNSKLKTVPIVLVVQPQGSTLQRTITVQALAHPDINNGQGYLGVGADDSHPITIRPPLWKAPWLGVQDIGTTFTATVGGIQQVIRGLIPAREAFSGPVGIVTITGRVASDVPVLGWNPILFLAGFLSLNLAFFNVLPIPALDGGRLLFILIEVLRRGKRVSPEREGLVTVIGMACLLLLVFLVTLNDVGNLFAGH